MSAAARPPEGGAPLPRGGRRASRQEGGPVEHLIAADTGGTFTDGVFRLDGRVVTTKVDTTPHDPVHCFLNCIESGATLLGREVPELLAATDVIRYSTTAATNAMIQRRGARIGLIVTAGAEQHLYCAGGPRSPLWQLLEPGLVRGVQEAVDAQGHLQCELDAEGLRRAAEELLDGGARLLVVAFANAALNAANERRVRELFREWFPGHYLGTPFVLLSHEVGTRGSNAECLHGAVLSGYLHRQLVSYLYRCDDAVRSRGFRHPLLVVHSSGGVARVAKTRALDTYNSGPTAGVFGAARLARRYRLPFVLTADIGGTSTDVAFIVNGTVALSFKVEIEGIPVNLPMIDVLGLGGGGGSFAQVQDGVLQVGPDSAGAVPGPACYDLGNARPTVTDADLVLGFIDADNFLGGRRRLAADLARRAIDEHIAAPLGVNTDAAAQRVREVLARGLALSILSEAERRGVPLDDAVLFAYGGAGPLHAADIAAAVGIGTFYVFPESPVFSAAGSSTMNIAHVYERRVRDAADGGFDLALRAAADELLKRARRDVRGEGFDFSRARVSARIETPDGRLHPLDLTGSALLPTDATGTQDALLMLSVTLDTASAEQDAAAAPAVDAAAGAVSSREIAWPEGRMATPVYGFAGLAQGQRVAGPTVIASGETSCVVPHGWSAAKDEYGAIRVHRS